MTLTVDLWLVLLMKLWSFMTRVCEKTRAHWRIVCKSWTLTPEKLPELLPQLFHLEELYSSPRKRQSGCDLWRHKTSYNCLIFVSLLGSRWVVIDWLNSSIAPVFVLLLIFSEFNYFNRSHFSFVLFYCQLFILF